MKTLFYTAAALLLTPVLFLDCAAAVELQDNSVRLQIACAQSRLRAPTNAPILVSITNASTNIVTASLPVCHLAEYEVWITDAAGRATNLVVLPKPRGPEVSSGRGSWRIDPGNSFSCTLEVPLPEWVSAGRYTVVLKRWCSIYFLWRSDSFVRKHLQSNTVELEIIGGRDEP